MLPYPLPRMKKIYTMLFLFVKIMGSPFSFLVFFEQRENSGKMRVAKTRVRAIKVK
jgi:hypothetical protein